MDAVGDTYAISESDFQDAGPSDGSKHSVAAIVDMMKKINLPKLPKLPGRAAAGSVTLVQHHQQLSFIRARLHGLRGSTTAGQGCM
jgi:hypothetical protein